MRTTCAAVTRGTPSCNTLAVMHISAMPPGAVTRIMLATLDALPAEDASASSANTVPNTAETAIPSKALAVLANRNTGAERRKERENREPKAQPRNICPALEKTLGMALNPIRRP